MVDKKKKKIVIFSFIYYYVRSSCIVVCVFRAHQPIQGKKPVLKDLLAIYVSVYSLPRLHGLITPPYSGKGKGICHSITDHQGPKGGVEV
jgi:hypothetical protein